MTFICTCFFIYYLFVSFQKDLSFASVEDSLCLLNIAIKKCEEHKNFDDLKGMRVDLPNIFVLPAYSDSDFFNFLTEKRKKIIDAATFPTACSTTASEKESVTDGNQSSVKKAESNIISVRTETQSDIFDLTVKQISEDCNVSLEDCINAFCHPSVISLVKQIIQSNKMTNASNVVKEPR